MKKILCILSSLSFFAKSMTVVSCAPMEPGVSHIIDATDDLAIILSTNPGSVGIGLTSKHQDNDTVNKLKNYADGLINSDINKNVNWDHSHSTIDIDWELNFFLDNFDSDFCKENDINNNVDLNEYYITDKNIIVPLSFKISALKNGNLKGEVTFNWSLQFKYKIN